MPVSMYKRILTHIFLVLRVLIVGVYAFTC